MVGPAPRRHSTGFRPRRTGAKINEVPPMTVGQQQFNSHKSKWKYRRGTSDPENVSDPVGFPRNMLYMTRGIVFAPGSGKELEKQKTDSSMTLSRS